MGGGADAPDNPPRCHAAVPRGTRIEGNHGSHSVARPSSRASPGRPRMSSRQLPASGQAAAENELLAQLGLPPSASPEDVDQSHEAVSEFLAAAPPSIRGWAHAQAAALDAAYLSLTDPVGLQGSALRSPTRPPAVVPGGPATPPARRDPLPAAPPPPADDLEDLEAGASRRRGLAALYASVTPSAHSDMGPDAPQEEDPAALDRRTAGRRRPAADHQRPLEEGGARQPGLGHGGRHRICRLHVRWWRWWDPGANPAGTGRGHAPGDRRVQGHRADGAAPGEPERAGRRCSRWPTSSTPAASTRPPPRGWTSCWPSIPGTSRRCSPVGAVSFNLGKIGRGGGRPGARSSSSTRTTRRPITTSGFMYFNQANPD